MKSTKGVNVTSTWLNSSQWKVWTLNTVEYLEVYWNKICRKKLETPLSVQQTTSTVKDFKKYKNRNKNALPFISWMILIKHKQITQSQQKRSLKSLKRLLIWAKHFQDSLCKIFKIILTLQFKIHFLTMFQVIFKRAKKANLLILTKS